MHTRFGKLMVVTTILCGAMCAVLGYQCFKLRTEKDQLQREVIQPLKATLQQQQKALSVLHDEGLLRRTELASFKGAVARFCDALETERKKTDSVRTQLQQENAALKRSLESLAPYYEKLMAELPQLSTGQAKIDVQKFLAEQVSREQIENTKLQSENTGLRAQVLEFKALLDQQNAKSVGYEEHMAHDQKED